MNTFRQHWSIVLALLLTPLYIWGTCAILPTFDDWTSLIAPSFGPFFTKERFLFYGYHWRPFDSTIGWIVGRNPQLLFPTLNHICVVLGHTVCTLLVYRLTAILRLNTTAKNIATLFFFITPAMLATVLAVDGLNQTYASLWGLAALVSYLSARGTRKYALWILFTVIATLCKENGLMWILIAPVFAFGFGFADTKTTKKDLLIGGSIILAYAAAIVLLPSDITIHPEYEPGALKMVKNFFKFLLTTFVCIDFVSFLHQPSRNWTIAIVTLLLSAPFLYAIFARKARLFASKPFICLAICMLMAAAPHILTIFSMMHTYAALPLVAVAVAWVADKYEHKNSLRWTFLLFVLSATFIDLHLWNESVKSGLMSRDMSREIIQKTKTPVNNVSLIIIEDDYPKLSSFCVIPSDAIGWGIAVRHENNYQWPETIRDTLLVRQPGAEQMAEQLARKKIKDREADCAWIIDHKDIKVIR